MAPCCLSHTQYVFCLKDSFCKGKLFSNWQIGVKLLQLQAVKMIKLKRVTIKIIHQREKRKKCTLLLAFLFLFLGRKKRILFEAKQ